MSVLQTLMAGGSGATQQYEVNNSIKFDSRQVPSITKTYGTTGNNTRWTFSTWVRISPGKTCNLLAAGSGSQPYTFAGIDESGVLFFDQVSGGVGVGRKYTNQILKDPTQYYHIHLVWDTNNGTPSDRMQMYVNGTRLTSFSLSNDPTAGLASYWNSSGLHYIGSFIGTGVSDMMLSETHFIDGLALLPTSFAATDSNGQWSPIAYGGSYGTNGFRLKFDDRTSTTTLGYDSSGLANHWTLSGFSVAAGAAYSPSNDAPSNVFCVINPLYQATSGGGGVVVDANWGLTGGPYATGQRQGSLVMRGDKYYFECSGAWGGDQSFRVGVGDEYDNLVNGPGNYGASYAAIVGGGTITTLRVMNGGTIVDTGLAVGATPAVVMIAFDATSSKVWFGVNGTWAYGGDPANGLNPTYTVQDASSFTYSPVFLSGSGGIAATQYANFGQRAFSYTPPAGFKTLSTKNISSTPHNLSGYGFIGTGTTDGQHIIIHAVPNTLSIGGNPVVWGTHAWKTASGFKVITSDGSYNPGGSSILYTVSSVSGSTKYSRAQIN